MLSATYYVLYQLATWQWQSHAQPTRGPRQLNDLPFLVRQQLARGLRWIRGGWGAPENSSQPACPASAGRKRGRPRGYPESSPSLPIPLNSKSFVSIMKTLSVTRNKPPYPLIYLIPVILRTTFYAKVCFLARKKEN